MNDSVSRLSLALEIREGTYVAAIVQARRDGPRECRGLQQRRYK